MSWNTTNTALQSLQGIANDTAANTTYDTATIFIEPIYSKSQLRVLAWITYPSALLSLLGSGTILYWILLRNKQQRWNSFTRLMFGLSSMDLVCSLGLLVFGSWAVPKEAAALAYGARGTSATCEAAAVFSTLGIGTMLYTTFLAVYFCLRVRFQVSERTLEQRLEPLFHAIPILFVVGVAIAGLIRNDFNPLDQSSGFCWLADYPPNCAQDPQVDCIRGQEYKTLSRIAGSATILLCLVTIIVCMLLIVSQVMALEWRMRKYAHGQNAQWNRTKEVGTHALLYIFGFLLCVIWMAVQQLTSAPETAEYRHVHFPIAVLVKLMTPLQGFVNCLIFWRRQRGNVAQRQSTTRTSASTMFGRSSFLMTRMRRITMLHKPNQQSATEGSSSFSPRQGQAQPPAADMFSPAASASLAAQQEDSTQQDESASQWQTTTATQKESSTSLPDV